MLKFKEVKNFLLNFGPQHPAAHGVLRLILETDGEVIKKADSHIGLLHRGTEKLLENKIYTQGLPYFDRLDYVSMMAQELTFSMSIEKVLGITIPKRALHLRVVFLELTRILNHLLALTTHALDVGAMTPFLWAFEEREKLMEFYERVSGARLHANFIRPGGLAWDCNSSLLYDIFNWLNNFETHIFELENVLIHNRIFKQRLVNIGVMSAFKAFNWGYTGVMLRSTGIKWDLRKTGFLNDLYKDFLVKIPIGLRGDCYDRFLMRIQEMYESCFIIRNALELLPEGNVMSTNSKIIVPPRRNMRMDMEALIHHFKLCSEGYDIFKGQSYFALEAPKGEFGVFLATSNSNKPYRCYIRAPGFFHLQSLDEMSYSHMLADLVTIIGTQDIVFG